MEPTNQHWFVTSWFPLTWDTVEFLRDSVFWASLRNTERSVLKGRIESTSLAMIFKRDPRDQITFWEWQRGLNTMRFGGDWTSQSSSENMTGFLGKHKKTATEMHRIRVWWFDGCKPLMVLSLLSILWSVVSWKLWLAFRFFVELMERIFTWEKTLSSSEHSP